MLINSPMTYIYIFIAFIAFWCLTPILILATCDVPLKHKLKCALCMLRVGLMGLLTLPVELLAPVIVPLALLGIDRHDNRLPSWASWWDNDVSINGDRAEYWDPTYEGVTYYANAHPRSFWARYVWLGWRNRGSWLSQHLGYEWKPGDREQGQYWGDPLTGRDHEGWTVNECVGLYQFYAVKKLGKLCIRINYGYKIWANYDLRARAMIVTIPLSLLRWTGA